MTHSPDTGHHAPVRGNPIGVPTLWRAALVAFLFLCASVHAQWQSLNPGAGGQIQDIVLDPNTPGRLFYMSDVEGSYRSDDYGASWDLITQDAASSDHLTIAIEPGHADRVYLGRGDGISISDNGGLNWINVDGVEDPIMQIEINPDAPEECYAVVSQRWRWDQFPTRRTGTRNLYLSRDRGVSWKAVTYEPQNGLRDTYSISLHPVHREVLYLSGQAGLYRSGDRGESWTKVTPPTGSSSGVSWGAALSPDGRTLYATYVTPEKGAVLFARSETAPTDEAAAWINLFALGGSPEPPVGTYWIPRIDPGSTATEHRLLTAAFDNAPTGLIEFTVNVLDGQPVGRSWRPIMTWGGGAYGGNHRNPYTDDVGWELYWTRPLSWRYSPTQWDTGQRSIWSTKDQTLFTADTTDPAFPFNWEQKYCTLVSEDGGARTYRTTGTACMVLFDGHGFANHGMISAGDNGLMESWDDGFSWSIDKRPGSYAGSRSNAAAYTTIDGVTWALAHVATGFGADSENGTLYAKRLSDPPSKADRWIAIAGGSSERAGLPFQKYNPIVPDPSDPQRIYIASVWNPAKGSGHIHMTDDITSVIDGVGSFRKISGPDGPTVGSDQDMGLGVDPNNPAVIYAGGDGATVWKGTRQGDGTHVWNVIRTDASGPVVWAEGDRTHLACIGGGNSILYSINGGNDWRTVGAAADILELRNPAWYAGENLMVRGLVALGDSIFCCWVTNHEEKRGYGVFRGRINPENGEVIWSNFTGDLAFPYPMKARIIHNQGKSWLYLATWGNGLWRREITDYPEPDSSGRLMNLSVRAAAGTAENSLIPGFSISGPGEKHLLIRAVGPGLEAFKVPGFLTDPLLKVFHGPAVIDQNDDWTSDPDSVAELESAAVQVGAFPLETGSRDAALVINLPSSVYTAHARSQTDISGVALVELYDLDPETTSGKLVNLSARVRTSAGPNKLIAGFVVSGAVPQRIMIRAVGPGLETFGVKDTLPNPQVRLFTPTANNQSAEIAMNRDWDQSFDCNALKAAAESVGAFPLEPGSPDAALIKTVTAGVYSVQVSDEAEQGGIALVEIYHLN